MKYDHVSGDLSFESGTKVYASGDEIGIRSDLMLVTYGHDGNLNLPHTPGFEWLSEMAPDQVLKPADCVELADAMIARWQAFRAKHAAADSSTLDAPS